MASREARTRKVLRRLGLSLLGAVCLIGISTKARAANNCAWINEATVSGLLGGDAVGEVSTTAAKKETVCTFTQQSASGAMRTLQVTVELAADPHGRLGTISQVCGADVARLTAIGNEAWICSTTNQKAGQGERVVGRVRDQVFTITIATTLKNDRILSRDELKSRIYTAAEQVAGNLF